MAGSEECACGGEVASFQKPCTFVAFSTKFAQNFVLQAKNTQGLGMRLEGRGMEREMKNERKEKEEGRKREGRGKE